MRIHPSRVPGDELVSRCIQGCGEAWEAFLERYGRWLAAVSRRMLIRLGGRGAAGREEDLFSEVLWHLVRDDFRTLRSYRGGVPLDRWLRGVVARQAIQLLRRDGIRRRHETRAGYGTAWEGVERGPGRQAEISEETTRILESLPPRTRFIVRARYLDGWPVSQIALSLGTDPGTVRKDLFRFRKGIRRET